MSNIYMHFYETFEEGGVFCLDKIGMFCSGWKISMGSFVHPVKSVWDVLPTLAK